ncbi:root phototropism protein 3-like [Phoenix dactylifera]|uniref:Root phototropism protein 3-like n=1 Tax=Phoenix dactylifera TaxID=42345 RepID=A0A8B8J6T7_PHODC|nr:root phototropism protein 3-like [Phoenix dactylifera]
MWETKTESQSGRRGYYNYSFNPDEHDGLSMNEFTCRDNSWSVSSDVPSDLLVKVESYIFHLHKYPLITRSGKMNRIVNESPIRDSEPNFINLDDLPGGPEAFELAARFCYGIAVDLTASNIASLRCAAEYLEMTEDLEEGNLIFKTEAFLSYVVLSSWRDSIAVLKSCEDLSPWAENLQIVRRCSESIAWKACASPKGIKQAHTGISPKTGSPQWNSRCKEGSSSKNQQVPPDWWFEDVSTLRIDHFVRVVVAIKVKGMRFELIGAAIMNYASTWLPGLASEATQNSYDSTWNRGGRNMIVVGNSSKEELLSGMPIREQCMLVESLISIIPPIKDCVSCSFLLQLLRLANMLQAAHALIEDLEKRIGMQLEQASLADLLIPSYSKCETFYDVELVRRLVQHFMVQEQTGPSSPGRESSSDKHRQSGASAKARVARLLDGYLAEVSRDQHLSPSEFQALAEALPKSARTSDDGLYRAIDSYLKAHPTLSEHGRRRLCRLMDCQKLSVDACMHAAQNDRLPLRFAVQILFSEQVKISKSIANSSLEGGRELVHCQPMLPTQSQLPEGRTPRSFFQEGRAAEKKDINTLKYELEDMKAKYTELQREMDSLQSMFEKMASPSSKTIKHQSSRWTSRWKKLGKLTRITGMGDNEMEAPVEARKEPRRRRYSIS